MKHLPWKKKTEHKIICYKWSLIKEALTSKRPSHLNYNQKKCEEKTTFDQQRWSLGPCFLHFLSTHLQNEGWSDEALYVKVRQVRTAGIKEGEIVLHLWRAVPDGRHQLLDADPRLVHLHRGIEDHMIWEYLYEHAGIYRDFVGIVWDKSTAKQTDFCNRAPFCSAAFIFCNWQSLFSKFLFDFF